MSHPASTLYLVKNVTDIGLTFSKPHGEQLRPLDGDKIGLALIRNGLGQEGLATARRSIEEHTS